ncbi:glycosyltransferase family 2 protein [Candidatus Venteria ishoeyi]|uniref:Hyaluronan synthase n=1 Tax=Candidatus Venteria ishoeyi TaxID=1899563 RepID=A0A1H6FAQ8_9GAMM|nr:glycosyltransferase [Candidatus Venteria ishoeyi]SEH06713.1 Hyaluronan synthase [Candidatus Venteria ishoeyi]
MSLKLFIKIIIKRWFDAVADSGSGRFIRANIQRRRIQWHIWQAARRVNTHNEGLRQQLLALRTSDSGYFIWLLLHKLYLPHLLSAKNKHGAQQPYFSILVPVYNSDPVWLQRTVDSVISQHYPRWELILCDDASPQEDTRLLLKQLAGRDRRIHLAFNARNQGISRATNHAAKLAQGDWLVLLDHDDTLYADALEKLAEHIGQQPQASVFYSDEDRLSAQGFCYQHNFKPGFSPSLLETQNYILHLVCVTKTAFEAVGCLRSGFDGSQDYDLLLRLLSAKHTFFHIPQVLYSWGESDTSMVGGQLKPAVFDAGRRALIEYFARTQARIDHISTQAGSGDYHAHFKLPTPCRVLWVKTRPDAAPLDLPLPTFSANWQVDEIIAYDGISPIVAALSQLSAQAEPYDFILFCRAGLDAVDFELVLSELGGWALRPQVGVVAGLIVNQQQQILHAGFSYLPSGRLQADFQGRKLNDTPLVKRVRDCSVVSGDLLAMRPDVLQQHQEIQGISHPDYWFVALCLAVQQQQQRVVYLPWAAMEARARGLGDFPVPARPPRLLKSGRSKIHHPTELYLNPNLISPWNDWRLPNPLPDEPQLAQTIDNNTSLSFMPYRQASPLSNNKPPQFSIILTTWNSHLGYLREMLESIHIQQWSDFEVCIADDASDKARLRDYLKNLGQQDSRFVVQLADTRLGIAGNTNRALAKARGEWLLFCDHDDVLESHALQTLADYIQQHASVDLVYSDETLMDEHSVRHNPHHRPDWNPDMFTSQMYFPHLVAVRRSLVERVGQLNPALDGAQDYDFHLRTTEQARAIGHIPKVLYAWRMHPDSVAMDAASKLYAYESGRRALANAMSRRGETVNVLNAPGTALGVYRVKRKVQDCTISHILAVDSAQAINSIRSIRQCSRRPVEIIAVLSGKDAKLAIALRQADAQLQTLIVADDHNRAQRYNAGARIAQGQQLIFSPDSVELVDSDYPDALLEHSQRSDIGAVAGKLIYPNGCYYHTGLLLGVNGFCGYAHRNIWQGPGYWYYALVIRNYTALSWDFMAVSRPHWQEVDGFDEQLAQFADVDFCLKLGRLGLRQVYTPYASGVFKRAVHHLEALQNETAADILIQRYGAEILQDPQYHPRLSKQFEDFSEC